MGHDRHSRDVKRTTPHDRALTVLAIASSTIPVMGGPIAEVVNRIPTDRERRQLEFITSLDRKVRRLGASLDLDFVRGEDFAGLMEEVLEKGSRRRELEKREVWANALANAARGRWSADEDGWRLVDLLEGLRPQHLRSLALIATTRPIGATPDHPNQVLLDEALSQRYPDLNLRVFQDDWADFQRRGLVGGAYPFILMFRPGDEDLAGYLTPLGTRFVSFIGEPDSDLPTEGGLKAPSPKRRRTTGRPS